MVELKAELGIRISEVLKLDSKNGALKIELEEEKSINAERLVKESLLLSKVKDSESEPTPSSTNPNPNPKVEDLESELAALKNMQEGGIISTRGPSPNPNPNPNPNPESEA